MRADIQTRTYKRSESAIFSKTKETFGGLSNMAAGFPVRVNGVRILTSEALYQACRFPHRPEVQRIIIGEASPMTAKMKSKPYRQDSRPDWDRVRIKIMRWCLRVKLAQNWNEFSRLLLATRGRPIVEKSRKDDFWGAKVVDEETLVGMNVLGRLLMELREEVKQGDRERLSRVEPLDILDFRLYGEPISAVEVRPTKSEAVSRPYKVSDSGTGFYDPQVGAKPEEPHAVQAFLFDSKQQVEANTSGGGLMAALKPYSEYKESGTAWIGTIPKQWNLLPNRAIFAEVKDKNHPDEEMLSVTITRGIIRQKALLEGSSKKDSSNRDRSAYKLVCPQDIAYNKMRAWQGAIGVSDYRGIVSPAYVVVRLRENHNPRYFHYLFRTPHFAKEAERWSYGITSDMWSLRPEHFKLIYTPLPTAEEQVAIVRFLDHVNRRIERAIRAKRKVIALLNEQKEAIIHRAVTRGLDPNVSLKPSGVPWLGDIPEHWEVRRIKYLVKAIGGMTPNKGVARYWGGQVPWVSPKDMKVREIADSRDHITEVALRETNITLIQPSAVLIVVRGMILARLFPTALTVAPVTVNQDMKALILKPELDADYLVSMLTGIQREVLNLVEESGHGTRCLRTDAWENFSVPLLPINEQLQINEKIKESVAGLSTTIVRLEGEIGLLREYQTRLTADVVTGKLDVREAARSVPFEIEEAEVAAEAEEIEEEEGIEELASAGDGNE